MKMLMQDKTVRLMAATLTVSLMALTITACKPKGAIPKSADGRVEDFAKHLPGTTQGAVFVGELGKMRSTLTTIKTEIGSVVPQVEAMQKEFTKEINLDVFDVKTYEAAGIADAGMGAAFVQERIVLMIYVKDQQKFDTYLANNLKKATGGDAPKVETVDGAKVKVMGAGDKQVAWIHDGKLAIITTPAPEGKSSVTAPALAASLTKTAKDKNLAATPAYARYKKAYPADKFALTVFGNAAEIAKSEHFKRAVEDAAKNDPNAKASVEWYQKNAQALGLGLAQQNNELRLKAFFGGTDAFNKEITALGKGVAKAPWKKFVTKKTILGVRSSLNLVAAWTLFKASMPAEERTKIEKSLKEDSAKFGMDLEKDVLANLTGNIGVFFNGIDLAALMAAQKNPMSAVNGLNVVVGVQVKDKEKAKKLLGAIVEKSQGKLTLGDWEGGHKMAIEGAGNIYLKNDLVLFGTPKATGEEIKSYLAGKTEQPTNELGQRFAKDGPYNGIYLNVSEVASLLGPLLAMAGEAAAVVQRIDAMALEADGGADGMNLTLKVQLKPTAGGAK